MTYDAADNSAKCYSLAVHELRLQGLRDGKFAPLDVAEELIASGKAKDYRRIGPHTLYLGDCREILPTLGKVDAVVTDPPYGIGFAAQPTKWQRRAGHEAKAWDDDTVDLDEVLSMADVQCVWGGNYYDLPPSRGWLSWFKPDAPPSMGSVEFAWTNLNQNARQISYSIGSTNAERVGHPTQKPLAVMLWTLRHIGDAEAILDPFMGSGTTLVAAQKLGRTGIGIEREPKYFAIACRRLEQAMAQPDLFIPQATKPVQEVLAL